MIRQCGPTTVLSAQPNYQPQHCFICRLSDSVVSEDAGIEPRTVATSVLAVRRSNHSARSQVCIILLQYTRSLFLNRSDRKDQPGPSKQEVFFLDKIIHDYSCFQLYLLHILRINLFNCDTNLYSLSHSVLSED
jgi:hypothetical protein